MYSGTVLHGDARGKLLNWPTANLDLHPNRVKLDDGVYAAKVDLGGETYMAAFVVRKNLQRFEVYLIDYNGSDFYGKNLTVDPIQQIGRIEFIPTDEELKKKIHNDVAIIRAVFEDHNIMLQ